MFGLKRDSELDKYYTKPEIAKQCIDTVKEYFYLENFDNIIEPSAGNGSFSNQIENVLAYDIKPEHPSIIKKNFFKVGRRSGSTIIIGNPPFGRQSCAAKSFILHACKISSVVAFVLPKSFKKRSLQNVFPLQWHLVVQKDLPDNSFTVSGVEHDVPCVFQIWEKLDTNRDVPEFDKPGWLCYTTATNADISIRRVGVNAGVASRDLTLSRQSHYFIKITNRDVDATLSRINAIKWEFNNSVGPRSISKSELHEKLMEF